MLNCRCRRVERWRINEFNRSVSDPLLADVSRSPSSQFRFPHPNGACEPSGCLGAEGSATQTLLRNPTDLNPVTPVADIHSPASFQLESPHRVSIRPAIDVRAAEPRVSRHHYRVATDRRARLPRPVDVRDRSRRTLAVEPSASVEDHMPASTRDRIRDPRPRPPAPGSTGRSP